MRGKCKFISNLDYCLLCGKPAHGVHHLLFGKDRACCDSDGIYIPICDECHIVGKYRIHDNPTSESLSKMLGQAMWLAYDIAKEDQEVVDDSFERFRKRYGRSYL